MLTHSCTKLHLIRDQIIVNAHQSKSNSWSRNQNQKRSKLWFQIFTRQAFTAAPHALSIIWSFVITFVLSPEVPRTRQKSPGLYFVFLRRLLLYWSIDHETLVFFIWTYSLLTTDTICWLLLIFVSIFVLIKQFWLWLSTHMDLFNHICILFYFYWQDTLIGRRKHDIDRPCPGGRRCPALYNPLYKTLYKLPSIQYPSRPSMMRIFPV